MGRLAATWALCGRATYLRRRRLVTTAAALFSYAQPQRWRAAPGLSPICKEQWLDLRFSQDSEQFFSLVVDEKMGCRYRGLGVLLAWNGWMASPCVEPSPQAPMPHHLGARSAMHGLG
jgi:hypothetical protein